MKFEINVGTDYSTVILDGNHRPVVWESIFNSLTRLGGTCKGDAHLWNVPFFITSQVIEQVIHNTCFVCGGLMKTELKDVDNIAAITVRKCSSCGHSHT